MAYRSQFNPHSTDRAPTYYANNRLYPNSNAPVETVGRTSRRIHDGLTSHHQMGLEVGTDDTTINAEASPYYINGRHDLEDFVGQRASSVSVQGIKLLLLPEQFFTKNPIKDEDVETTLTLWQGKQIRFEMPYEGKIVGNSIRIRNIDACTGILSIYISTTPDGEPLYETAVDLCTVSQDRFEDFDLLSSTVIDSRANPRGIVWVRLAIENEITAERSANPFNTGRKIEIAATGKLNHQQAVVEFGDKNMPEELIYEYHDAPSAPLVGFTYTSWHSIPTVYNGEEKVGATVSLNGYRYDLVTFQNDDETRIMIYDRVMNKILDNYIEADSRAKNIGIVQAKNEVYFVDGYSPLRKFTIGEWKATKVDPGTDDPDDVPVEGASIIIFFRNRIYLAGCRYDPNFMQCSVLTEAGSDFDNYHWRWYIPDNYPQATSLNPITAVVPYTDDEFLVMLDHGWRRLKANVDYENGVPSQVGSPTDLGGSKDQGDVVNFEGVVYAFNPENGIRRFTGLIWRKLSGSDCVDPLFDRVDMDRPRKLWGYAHKLYFNYYDVVDGKAKCLVYDLTMNYQSRPWFQDCDIPFCDVRVGHDFDLVGVHPDYPCIINHYAADTWARLDTPIVFERWTKHFTVPGDSADLIVKRVHNMVVANANRHWLIGLEADKQNQTQFRGREAYWRMPTWATIVSNQQPENPFSKQPFEEEDSVFRLTISNIRIRGSSVQVKLRAKTFRAPAQLLTTVIEAGIRQYL